MHQLQKVPVSVHHHRAALQQEVAQRIAFVLRTVGRVLVTERSLQPRQVLVLGPLGLYFHWRARAGLGGRDGMNLCPAEERKRRRLDFG